MYVNIIDTRDIIFCQITTLLIDCVAFSFGLGNGGGALIKMTLLRGSKESNAATIVLSLSGYKIASWLIQNPQNQSK